MPRIGGELGSERVDPLHGASSSALSSSEPSDDDASDHRRKSSCVQALYVSASAAAIGLLLSLELRRFTAFIARSARRC